MRALRMDCVCILALAAGLTGIPVAASAQDAAASPAASSASSATDDSEGKLAEIVVTAERRSSNLQHVAGSVTAVTGADLLRQGRFSQREILQDIPGVDARDSVGANFAGGTDAVGNNVTIRGVLSNSSPTALSAVPTTAIYTDGVYEGIGSNYDIARVEVLRGPQGTLYGRSATAGVVATYTNDPLFGKVGADATLEAGGYDLLHGTGAINLPLGDKLALRISGNYYQRDGYYSSEGGKRRSAAVRAKLLYKPTDNLRVLVGAAYEDNRTHTGGLSGTLTGPNELEYNPAPVRGGKNSFQQYWAEVNWDLGPVTVTYLPAFRKWNQNAVTYVFGPLGMAINNPIITPHDHFWTQELRFASSNGSPFHWQGGAFYYDNSVRNSNISTWDSSGGLIYDNRSQRKTKDVGLFGEVGYTLAETWRLTAGLRYDHTYVQTAQDFTNNVNAFCNTPLAGPDCPTGPVGSPDAGNPPLLDTLSVSPEEGTRKFNTTTFKLRLEHDLAPSSFVYAMASSGFLPGDVQVSTGAGNRPVLRPYKEEVLTAYEIGSKNRFLDNRLQVNASAFYYDYGGLQTLIIPDPLNPGSTLITSVPARYYGAELETAWALSRDDRLTLDYAYVNARYRNKPTEFATAVAQDQIPGVVPHTVTGSYSHVFRFGNGSNLTAEATGIYRSRVSLTGVTAELASQGALDYVSRPGEAVVDLGLTWTAPGGAISVTGYVRNVTDNRFLVNAGVQRILPVFIGGGASQYDPRTWGVQLSAHF